MRTSRVFATFLVVCLTTSARSIQLNGVVTDRGGGGLAGLEVTLVGARLSTLTGEWGEWELPASTVPVARPAAPIASGLAGRWSGPSVELSLPERAVVRIDVVQPGGEVRDLQPPRVMDAGFHRVRVDLAPGVSWVRVRVGREMLVLPRGGTRIGPFATAGGSGTAQAAAPLARRSLETPDTLQFRAAGRLVAEVALRTVDTTGIVVRLGTDSSVVWNPAIPYGHFYDTRDGNVYRTVRIGTQEWLAENLNFVTAGSWWYLGLDKTRPDGSDGFDSLDETVTKGARYGRYYKWSALMALPDSCNNRSCRAILDVCQPGSVCRVGVPMQRRGVCPTGWHVPSDAEWTTLTAQLKIANPAAVGQEARILASLEGWTTPDFGTDAVGFRGLPAGNATTTGVLTGAGTVAIWWSATAQSDPYAWYRDLYTGVATVFRDYAAKSFGYPARCVRD